MNIRTRLHPRALPSRSASTFAIALTSVLALGCKEPTPPGQGEAPSHTAQAPTAQLEDTPPPVRTFTFAQRIEQVGVTPRDQLQLAELIDEAIAADDPEKSAMVLRTLGRRLSHFRGNRTSPELAAAAQRFASTLNPQLAAMQPRYTIPLAELLLDMGDLAALERLAEHAGSATGAEHVQRATRAARAGREARVPLTIEGVTCALSVDGEPAGPGPLELAIGSHVFACAGTPQLITLQARPYLVRQEGEALVLEPNGEALPPTSAGEPAAGSSGGEAP